MNICDGNWSLFTKRIKIDAAVDFKYLKRSNYLVHSTELPSNVRNIG